MSKAPLTPIQLDYESQPVTRVIYAQETGHPGFKLIKSEAVGAADAGVGEEGTGQAKGGTAYELVREIARGGMGVVYEARHQELGRTVALKIMRGANFANFDEVGRFRAEAEAVARLDHPNIIPIYEVGELQGQPFFTMKLVEGGSLADRVGKDSLPPREAARLMVKIARAVQHAHERGVLHRDLKPANILVDAQGEPYLSDFGIAKFAGQESGLTNPGDLVGTPAYVSPEQAFSGENLTTASDVWSLGVMLYQMLSGRLPFAGGSEIQMMQRIMHEEAAPLTGVPTPSGRSFAPAATTQFVEATPNFAPRAKTKPAPGTLVSPSKSALASPAASAQNTAEPTTISCARLDRDLVTIVSRCLEKEPGRRLPSAKFLADELDRWLAGEPIRSRHITPAERVWKWMHRFPYRVAAILALLVCILAGSITSFQLWCQARTANVNLNSVNGSLTHANVELARSLRIATATRLASESRVQGREDPTLGLLLAVKSAETTPASERTILPESASALFSALQRVGGSDASASRGLSEGDLAYRVFTARTAWMRPSPDGRWFVSIDFCPEGIVAALYAAALPLHEEPLRRWKIQAVDGIDINFFEAIWTSDSQHLLTVDNLAGELFSWDLLAGLDAATVAARSARLARDPVHPAHPTPGEFQQPPSRSLGLVPSPGSLHYAVNFLHDPAGQPNALLYLEKIGDDFILRRRPLDLTLPQPLGVPTELVNLHTSRRLILRVDPAQRWAFLTEPFLKNTPLLIRLPGGEKPLAVCELPEAPTSIDSTAYSPDGRWVVFARRDGHIRLYDLAAGDLADVARSGRDVLQYGTACFSLSFSPDCRWLAASGGRSNVQLIGVGENHTPLENLPISGRTSGAVTFSPDSLWLAVGGEDRIASVWRLSDLALHLRPIEFCGISASILDLDFSADGRVLSALGSAGECRRWEFNGNSAGAIPLTSAASETVIQCIAATPDGHWFATAGQPVAAYSGPTGPASPIRLFRVGETLTEYALPGHYYPTGVAVSPDGRWLASTGRDAAVRVWPLPALTAALEARQPLPEPLVLSGADTRLDYDRRLAFHPRGHLYCTCGDGILYDWNLHAPDPAATVVKHLLHSIKYILSDVTVSPDGRWLAVGRHGNDNSPLAGETQFGNMVLLYDVSDPDKLVPREELWSHFREHGRLVISPDNHWLAAGSHGGSPEIWDLQAEKIASSVRNAPVTAPNVNGVAFSPASAPGEPVLALGDTKGLVHLWDWQHGPANLRRIELGESVNAVAFLPDGRLITGSRDSRLRIWEIDSSRLIDMARRTAGRELNEMEKSRFLGKPQESHTVQAIDQGR